MSKTKARGKNIISKVVDKSRQQVIDMMTTTIVGFIKDGITPREFKTAAENAYANGEIFVLIDEEHDNPDMVY
jgi:hypothetical protein